MPWAGELLLLIGMLPGLGNCSHSLVCCLFLPQLLPEEDMVCLRATFAKLDEAVGSDLKAEKVASLKVAYEI